MREKFLLAGFITGVIIRAIRHLSPAFREALERVIEGLEEKTNETKSPWDDLFVDVLKILLDFREEST